MSSLIIGEKVSVFHDAFARFHKDVRAYYPFIFSCELRAHEFTQKGASLSLLSAIARTENCLNQLLKDVQRWKDSSEAVLGIEERRLVEVRSEVDKGFEVNGNVGQIENGIRLLHFYRGAFSAIDAWLLEKIGKLKDWKGSAVSPEELDAMAGIRSEKPRARDEFVEKVFAAFKNERIKIVENMSGLASAYFFYELLEKNFSFRKSAESHPEYRCLKDDDCAIWQRWSSSLKAQKENLQNAMLFLSQIEKFLDQVQNVLSRSSKEDYIFPPDLKEEDSLIAPILLKPIREIEKVQETALFLKRTAQEGDLRFQHLVSTLEAIKGDLALLHESFLEAIEGYERPMKWADEEARKLSSYLPAAPARETPYAPAYYDEDRWIQVPSEYIESCWERFSEKIEAGRNLGSWIWKGAVALSRIPLRKPKTDSGNLHLGSDAFKKAIAQKAAKYNKKNGSASNRDWPHQWMAYVFVAIASIFFFEMMRTGFDRYFI